MVTRVSEVRRGTGLLGEEDDRALVLAFQEGEPDAFATIYRRYRPLAGAVCLKILGNREDAEEAAQETMLRVLQGLPRFNGRYQLAAWVARIATNVSLDALRARSRRPPSGGSTDEIEELRGAGAEDPLELVERLFEREQVRAVLEELPPHHREALVLREFEGRSHREIGERLGITPAQAKALIHRAKGTFRRAWDGDGRHRGLAALLAVLPGRGWFRRLLSVPHDAAAAASTHVQVAAAEVASAPLATAAGPGERLLAGAMALLIAGGVGAVAVREAREPGPGREPRRTSQVAAVAVPDTLQQVAPKPAPIRVDRERRERRKEEDRAGVEAEAPTPEPSVAPEPAASPSPGPAPEPPPPPPAPAWSLALGIDAPTYSCGCAGMVLVSEAVYGRAGDGVRFQQTARGPVPAADGSDLREVGVTYFGEADAGAGRGGFRLVLYQDTRTYEYEGTGDLVEAVVAKDGQATYLFEGTFRLVTVPDEADAPVLREGTFHLRVTFWVDGTSLYRTELSIAGTGGAEPAA